MPYQPGLLRPLASGQVDVNVLPVRSGLRCWLQSQPAGRCFTDTARTNPADNAETVAAWQDASGSGLHVTEATNKFTLTNDDVNPAYLGAAAAANARLTAASAADWKFLHDGTGCTVFIAYRLTDETIGVLFDTGGLAAGAGGVALFVDDTGAAEGFLDLRVRNASGQIASMTGGVSTNNLAPAGQTVVASYSYQEGRTGEVRLFIDGALVNSADTSGAPAAGAPASPLILGRNVANNIGWDGRIMEFLAYNRALSATEKALVDRYLAQRYGAKCKHIATLGDSTTGGGYAGADTLIAAALNSELGALYRATNFAVSGAQTPAMYSSQWTTNSRRKKYNIVTLMGGVNDILQTADSAATILSRLQQVYSEVLADEGNVLIAMTVLPWASYSSSNSTRQATTAELNNLIRNFAASNPNTRLVDGYLLFTGTTASDQPLPAAYDVGDQLHPHQLGINVLVEALKTTILSLPG